VPAALDEMVTDWLRRFEAAIEARSTDAVGKLFDVNASWRDMLALGGDLRTLDGSDQIARFLGEVFPRCPGREFHVLGGVASERTVRFGSECIEALFDFETEVGVGRGIVRFACEGAGSGGTAWMLMTSLERLTATGVKADLVPTSVSGAPGTRGNWLDERRKAQEFADREPVVVVLGAGQCGLAIAARLQNVGVDTLVIEKTERIGDSWRLRYRSLKLHNETCANHLPFIPFPKAWPKYIPKDKLANWLEFYAEALELNVWTNALLAGVSYAEDDGRWTVRCATDGLQRVVRPRHLVLAIGVSRIPRYPDLSGLAAFEGTTLHSHYYVDGREFAAKRVLVVGTGNSAHDVAQDLYSNGAEVTMMQRGPSTIVSLEPGAETAAGGLYRQDRPIDDLDLIRNSATYPIRRRWLKAVTDEILVLDRELISGLHAAGFKTDNGPDGTGFLMKYWRQGGGYYIDVGCSRLIIERKIKLIQQAELAHFTADGLQLQDGRSLSFDAVISASGYKSIQDGVRMLLGREVADRVGPVWGLDEEGELRNICKPTAQRGLWFMGGSLIEARSLSKYLAMQIQASEAGVVL
jgi:hypothetical protein